MRPLLSLVLLSALSGSLARSEDPPLRLDVEVGQEFHYVAELNWKNSTEVESGPPTTTRDTAERTSFDLTVLERDSDSVLFEKTLRAESISGVSDGLVVDYDSARGDPPVMQKENPAYFASRMIGQSLRVLVSPSNRILHVLDCEKMLDSALEGLPADHPARQAFTPEALTVSLADLFIPLPRWRVRIDSRWSEKCILFSDFGLHCALHRTFGLDSISMVAGHPIAIVKTESVSEVMADQAGFGEAVKTSGRQQTSMQVDLATGMLSGSETALSMEIVLGIKSGQPGGCRKLRFEESGTLRMVPH